MSVQADAGLENELDVEADVNGVEAAIELDGVDPDVGPGNAGVLDPHLGGAVDDLPTQVGQKYADVLEAVAVAAGVQDAVGLHANGAGISSALATTREGGAAGNEAIFRHDTYLRMDFGGVTLIAASRYQYMPRHPDLTGFYKPGRRKGKGIAPNGKKEKKCKKIV